MNEKDLLKEFRCILNEELDERFTRFEGRMDKKIEEKLVSLEERMDKKLDALEKRVDKKLDELELRIDNKLQKMHEDICVSVSAIMENMIENSERRMKKYMDERFDVVEERIGHVETRINLTDGRLLNVEKRQYNIEERISAQAGIVAEKIADYVCNEKGGKNNG